MGASGTSNVVTATAGNPPATITNLTGMPGNGQITLSWSAPNNGGSAIIRYEFRQRIGTTGTWSSWISTGSTATSRVVTGLANGTSYGFQVRAINTVGTSGNSNVATVTAGILAPPNAITNLTGTPGNGQVTLSWSAPNNNGSPIIRYEFRQRIGTTGTWSSWISTGSTATSRVVTGLANGTSFGFQVRAVNAIGASGTSDVVTVTAGHSPVQPPNAITNLTGTPGNGRITLSWSAPNHGGSAIIRYEFRQRIGTTGTWSSWITTGSTATSHVVTGLANGTSYGFQVRAVSAVGASGTSNVATVTAGIATAPAAITNLTGTPGNGRVTLNWSAPNNGGATIIRYEFRQRIGTTGAWSPWMSTGSTATSHVVTGLANGTSYGFQVRAINAIGTSGTSNVATVTP